MPETFAAWLQAQLDRLDVDGVAAAARRLGVSQSMVSNWLNGRTLPARRSVKKLAAALGVRSVVIDAVLELEDQQRRGRHVPGLGPEGDPLLLRRGRGYVINTGKATVYLEDPALVSAFFGFLERWPHMTLEEAGSLVADETDIPDPDADRGEGDAGGGEPSVGGASGAGDHGGRDR